MGLRIARLEVGKDHGLEIRLDLLLRLRRVRRPTDLIDKAVELRGYRVECRHLLEENWVKRKGLDAGE